MSKPGAGPTSGISSVDVLIPTERHPACRQREARSGCRTERENLAGDAKGKGTSGANREAESTDAPGRGGLPRSSVEAGQCPRSKGAGHRHWVGSTGNGRNPTINGRRQPSRDGTSRMMREYHVRICEGLGVKFPGPTRHFQTSGGGTRSGSLRLGTAWGAHHLLDELSECTCFDGRCSPGREYRPEINPRQFPIL